MKVISPDDTTHLIKFDPRFYEIGSTLTMNLYDEAQRINQDVNITDFTVVNRLIHLTFTDAEFSTLDFYENGKYQIRITDVDSSEILYRGKMIATTQTPQDYKLTNDRYI
jgi:hypothetical protein